MSPKQLLTIAQALRALSEVANHPDVKVLLATSEALRHQDLKYVDLIRAKIDIDRELNRE